LKNGLILFLLVLLAGQAFAVNCGMLDLETNGVELFEDSTKTVSFSVHNHGSERFYIDKVNAFDFDSGIHTEEASWQDVVLAGDEALVRVEIEAEKDGEGEKEAKVEIRGHFLGGRECGYRDIYEEFDVEVLKKPVQSFEPECTGFHLYTISEKFIDEAGEIEFVVKNDTGFDAVVKLESSDLSMGSSVFVSKAGEEKHFSTGVSSSKEIAELTYKVELSGCGIPSEKTIVYSSVYEPPTPPEPEFRDVELSSAVTERNGEIIASVSIYNPNNEAVEGLLEIEMPKGWSVQGEGIAEVDAFTEITAELQIVPPVEFQGTANGEIQFSFDGQTETLPIEVELQEGGSEGLGSAFVSLGSGVIAIGLLLVIVIVVVAMFAGPHPQDGQIWQVPGSKGEKAIK